MTTDAQPVEITDRKVSVGTLVKWVGYASVVVGSIVGGWNYVAKQATDKAALNARIEALERDHETTAKLWKATAQNRDAINDDRAAAGKPLLKWNLD